MATINKVDRDRIEENLNKVRERITNAAERADRNPADVALVAVTKHVPAPFIEFLLELGIEAIGENRPEEILRKQGQITENVPWHMIGHFQSKKIAGTLPHLSMLHSLHSTNLLARLDSRLGDKLPERPPLPILLQVNVSGESTKQGFTTDETPHAVDLAENMGRMNLRGFMTMAPMHADANTLHRIFGGLRELRDTLGSERLPELSMGMSADYETAVTEGATLVRIGSALFDGVDINQ